MQTRQSSLHSSVKSSSHQSTGTTGFHFYQESVCGYNSCACTSPHYHCQYCGFGTSELPHAIGHKESCSGIPRGSFTQSTRLQPCGSSQPSDQTEQCSTYDEQSITMTGSSVQSSPQVSNSGSHFYCRGGIVGPQQSPAFNPLLSNQNQSLYNGVFGPQTGYTNQNNFPPSGFNSYGHVEHPPWLSDTHVASSANGTPSIESGRNSRSISTVCNSQGVPHACCGNRISLLESIGMCSPLSTEIYRSKSPNCQVKSTANVEPQAWFCSQGMIGYGNQTNQNLQSGGYKCSEQFPSCAMSQMSSGLHEQGDLKHSGMSEPCFEQSSVNKPVNHCPSEPLKPGCMEQSRSHLSKYCSLPKLPPTGQIIEHGSLPIENKQQESGNFGSHAMMFGTTEELQEDMLYSQASVMLPMSGDNHNHPSTRSSMQFNHKNQSCHQSSVLETNKTFPSSQNPPPIIQHFQQTQSRCGLDPCEMMEGCLQLDNHPVFTYPQICADEDKTSNQGSSSGACESDIVVEETEEEELTESEISIEEMKSSVSTRCLVCNTSNSRFVHMSGNSPVTSVSHVPVATKLAQVVASDCPPLLPVQDDLICRRCLNLIDTVDCLENKLASAKQDIIQLFKGRVVVLKPPSNWSEDVSRGCSQEDENKDNILSCKLNADVGVVTEQNNEQKEEDIEIEETFPEKKVIATISTTTAINPAESEATETKRKEIENNCTQDVNNLNGPEEEEENVSHLDEDSDGKFQCNVCSKRLASKEYLRKHVQQHTKVFSFYCDRCGRGFMLRSGLENHLLMHAGEYRYQCEVCGKCFIQRHALEDHLRKHQGTFRLSCTECGKGFMYASSLHVHQRTHTGERPFVCEHCGKGFGSASNLTAHVRLCSGELPFPCDRCDSRFASASQLQVHVLARHEGHFRSQCSVCGKGFAKPCDLKAHARTHSGEKPHRCVTCGKCYSSVGNLNQHAKMHDKERPFKCSLCGKGFLRRSVLTRHLNQHAGVRPFKCGQCEKAFTCNADLHAHQKWHAGTIKRQTCPVCGKSMNHGLKVHMRIHSGHKPYECSECKAAFTVKSTLNKHIKLKHQHVS